MRLLITRPRPESETLARCLSERGIDSFIEPMLEFSPLPHPTLALDGVQAVLVTSRGGVRALADATPRREFPLYAVGDATAEVARQVGFEQVTSAAGSAADLAQVVRANLDADAGDLLHARGAHTAGDLSGDLSASGFTVREAVLYEAHSVEKLSTACVDAFNAGAFDGVLFFSPRSAKTFVNVARMAGLGVTAGRLVAYCFSEAVAQAAEGLRWRRIVIAPRPDLGSMMGLFVPEDAR